MFAQHAIACVLCELLCLELFNVFFQHENRFRYKFFDIVQFSRSCAPQPCGWKLDYFITEAIFCQALFSEAFRFLSNVRLNFQRCLIGSFRLLPAPSRSHSLWRPLALKYNTTSPAFCQHFFASFFEFFLYFAKWVLSGRFWTLPKWPRPFRLPFAKGRALAVSGVVLYYIITL